MKVVLAWFRRWGTWALVGALLAVTGSLWLLLRVARKKAAAHALTDRVLDLGRAADRAYAEALGDVAAQENSAIEGEIRGLVEDLDGTIATMEAEHGNPDTMDEAELAEEFNRRLDGADPDRGSGI